MRATIYIKLEMFNESIIDLKTILNINENINNKVYNAYAITELYYTYYYKNMYKEALKLLPILYDKKPINAFSLSISELVIKNNLILTSK